MSDNKNNTGSADRSKVNTTEPYEVAYWTKKFGVSAEELKAASKAVGSGAKAIEEYLKKTK
jgi:hypothetical protein